MISKGAYYNVCKLLNTGKDTVVISDETGVPFEIVRSIDRRLQQIEHMAVHQSLKRHVANYFKLKDSTILQYAEYHRLPFYPFAKLIVERIYGVKLTKFKIALNFIENMDDIDLKNQVIECIRLDEYESPYSNNFASTMGKHYEFMLYEQLAALKIRYLGESELRLEGYLMTPDVKLVTPLYLNDYDMVINWIESKAFFGDEGSHKKYYEDQYSKYYNRHGPGLVIYWFGCINELDDYDKQILSLDHMPTNISTFSLTPEMDESRQS